jgi:predicted O-methyltransferase YrrM
MSKPCKSAPPSDERDLLLAAADELHMLARALDDAGHPAAGLHLHGAASALDLAFPQPAGWWTDGFNGQDGRSRLFLQLIETLSPTALVETGTYRGTTTTFMARHFSGRIFTCEVDPRWFLTAKSTLAGFPQIDIRNEDSRDFLRRVWRAPPRAFFSSTSTRTGTPTCH